MFALDSPAEDATTLVITRILKAPRALVWKMLSDPYHLARWWGPKGFTNRVDLYEFKTGGRWHHVMLGPNGLELPLTYTFLEVTPPTTLTYRNADADPALFGDNPPPAFTTTLTLEDRGPMTLLTLVARFDTPEHKAAVTMRGFIEGTNQGFDKLEACLDTLP